MSSSATEFEAFPSDQEPQEPIGPQTIADHMLGDQPAASAREDRLGFGPYVAAVAKFLTDRSTKTPLTLSVEGLWGSGKSSFMQQLEEALKKLGKRKVVRFNAWQYNADEGLWAAFIDEFDAKLNSALRWDEKLLARLRLAWLRISWQGFFETLKAALWMAASCVVIVAAARLLSEKGVAGFQHLLGDSGKPEEATVRAVSTIGGAGGTIAAVVIFFTQLRNLFRSPASLENVAKLFRKPNHEDKLPFIRQITREFESLVTAYAGGEDVYIFIDDLDRCEYTKAAELMQALLILLSSAPKVALIIGLDREKVAAALAARQEELLPYLYRVQPQDVYTRGMEYGQRFIEKFIQVSYILPSAQLSGLKAMVSEKAPTPAGPPPTGALSERAIRIVTGEDDSDTLNLMVELADEVFDHNPRNVKQFVNAFRLQAFIAHETGLFENLRVTGNSGSPLTIPQLGKFVALCMRWPQFVEAAALDDSLLINLESWLRNQPKDDRRAIGAAKAPDWLNDQHLRALLDFHIGERDFRLSGVDFRLLSAISPARARSSSETAEPSAFESESTAEVPEPRPARTSAAPRAPSRSRTPGKATARKK